MLQFSSEPGLPVNRFFLLLSVENALWHQGRMHNLFTVLFSLVYCYWGWLEFMSPSLYPFKNEQAVCFLLRRKEREDTTNSTSRVEE